MADSKQISALQSYKSALRRTSREGFAGEHAYRPALKRLLDAATYGAEATNEPKGQSCGAPDFILSRKRIPIGYIETKDIGSSLDKALKTEQLDRYLGQPNVILTDYLEFRWFLSGEERGRARIGTTDDDELEFQADEDDALLQLLSSFASAEMPMVTSAKQLAVLLANSAKLIRRIIKESLASKSASARMVSQLEGFKAILLHDLDECRFADMYAQTICYGLFAAKCNLPEDEKLTRHSEAHFVPKTNPFLRRLFNEIAGADLDDEAHAWAVDDLISLLNRTDIDKVWSSKASSDPVLHFYETFLEEYSPEDRSLRGVFYTPKPIVEYIVHSVDSILKSSFQLDAGLADSSKTKVQLDFGSKQKSTKARKKSSPQQLGLVEKEVPKVLILDPAAGTGTFLHSVVERIHDYHLSKGNGGEWPAYIAEHLLPRLFGFELMMAPYAVAHMKLALQLKKTGYNLDSKERVGIYLTNTLQEAQPVSELQLNTLFAKEIVDEANAASSIKRDLPIMVVLGNPPYSNFGMLNKSDWVQDLLDDYKVGLKEKKLNLDDDFIKFIRFAQWRIEQTGSGVLAFITNNTYLDAITRRRMRESLLESFSNIYILNLHGSSKKEEKSPDGSKDENVFDIRQGVAIGIFVRNPQHEGHATVHHAEVWGTREVKYEFLGTNNVSTTQFKTIKPKSPYFFFVPKNLDYASEYDSFLSLSGDIFSNHNAGIQTKRDRLVYSFTKAEAELKLQDFRKLDEPALRKKYDLPEDGRDWTIEGAKKDVTGNTGQLVQVLYRPFDFRWTYYTGKSKGFMAYPRSPLMREALRPNKMLLAIRNARKGNCDSIFIAETLVDKDSVSPYDNATFFPLYLYRDPEGESLFPNQDDSKQVNLSRKVLQQVESTLPIRLDLNANSKDSYSPEDLLGYIYAVLHSPAFRKRYAENLTIDYPRIPITKDLDSFRRLASYGTQLIDLHLLKSSLLDRSTSYPRQGSDVVEEDFPQYRDGKVFINEEQQHFDGVSEAVWKFTIGGYRVCEKWLKERRGRKLLHADIQHVHRMLDAISKTLQTMSNIDTVIAAISLGVSSKPAVSSKAAPVATSRTN